MKTSIIGRKEKGNVETYTVKAGRYLFDIILDHKNHETLIFDHQREIFISEFYGSYLSTALKEIKQFLNLWHLKKGLK